MGMGQGGGVGTSQNVPLADSILNILMRDVLGNKEDAASDTVDTASLIALARELDANQNVPGADVVANALVRDVIGNKTDTKSLVKDISSLVALARMAAKEAWEAEQHVHGVERWLGASEDIPFLLAGANNDWGVFTQVMVPGDTPMIAGSTHFDAHRIEFADVQQLANLKPTKFQIAWSIVNTPDIATAGAAAILAGNYTEFIAAPEKAGKAFPIEIMMPRMVVETYYLFMRYWCFGANAVGSDTKVFFGVHEYTDPDV